MARTALLLSKLCDSRRHAVETAIRFSSARCSSATCGNSSSRLAPFLPPTVTWSRLNHPRSGRSDSNPNVTFQIYTHPSSGKDMPAAEQVGQLIEAALNAENERAQEEKRDDQQPEDGDEDAA